MGKQTDENEQGILSGYTRSGAYGIELSWAPPEVSNARYSNLESEVRRL